MNNTHTRRTFGFSLIEVLIAVVVLSFGLLALAALQGSLFKSSAEAKAQSVALGLAAEKLEYYRGYLNLAAYQAIDSGADAAAINVGGVAFNRVWTVTRYGYVPPVAPATVGNFALVASNTVANPAGFVANNEFKRVQVNVTWSDAQGAAQRVSLEEAIAGLNPGDSAKLGKLGPGATPRGPEVKIYSPEKQQEGVIPIATGGGTDTAATNPKPLVNGSNVVETRFDVLTYKNDATGTAATAQARVETSILGCSCDSGNAPTSGGKRPTYWDGHRYVIPEDAVAVLGTTYAPPAGVNAAAASSQSGLCTICCRDHHDPASLPAGAAKFDPRNGSHSSGHSLLNASTGALTGPIGGKYTESCRIIRVGGVFRVAADTYDDYMNVLNTKSLGLDVTSADALKSEYVPTTTATGNYQNFVRSYLDARVVSASPSNYNNAPSGIAAIETANSINIKTPVVFRPTDLVKWVHLRGLYIDYLEDSAVQAITDAKTDCPGTGVGGAVTAQDLQNCVLKVLPFTSINLTELGNWTPDGLATAAPEIVVANNNFSTTLSPSTNEPVRGKVTRGSAPTGAQTNAVATMRRSNSGLTTLIGGIDSEDATTTAPSTQTAVQPFSIQGGSSTGGGQFSVYLAGYPFASNANKPYINDVPTAICNPALTGNPYACTSSTLGPSVAQTLTLGNYNFQTSLTSQTLTLNCFDATTNTSTPHTFGGAVDRTINVCKNFRVASSNLLGTPGSPSSPDGALTESTPVNYAGISNGDVIQITLEAQADTPSYVCTFDGGDSSLDSSYTVSAAACP